MARMLPRSMQSKRSRAESLVFSILKRSLPEDYTVLHHVQWIQKEPGGAPHDGEADFVVAHPRKGALVLEVKGGGIRYDAEEGAWYSMSKRGKEARLARSPFEQAVSAKHDLRRFLRARPGWPTRWGAFGHAVCFPEATLDSRPLPDMDEHVVIDARAFSPEERFAQRVVEAMDYWAGDDRVSAGEPGFRMLVDALAHDVEIRQPLAVELEEADREIIRLSRNQFRVLDILAGARRVAVAGPAGSGKTLIATEKVRRLAAQGFRVVFTCFNRPLADHLGEALARVDGVDVLGFHQLCVTLAREAGVPVRGSASDPGYYERSLPDALADAAARLGPRYDAIVADEGQDFDASWWLPLLMLLRDPDDGVFYVFYDDNQAIYRKPGGLPEGLLTTRLGEDWRNSEPIYRAVMQFYEGEDVRCEGPDGPPIEMRSVTKEELPKELSRVLHRLVVEGDVGCDDVVVLTPHAAERSPVRGRIGSFTLTDDPRGPRDIRLSSIYRFKGLDAKVVVVCDVDRYVTEDFTKLMYVACSRARTMLVVLLTERSAIVPS